MTAPQRPAAEWPGGQQFNADEEPLIFAREDWASRADYDPDRNNPNRFWNNGRGLPRRIDQISQPKNAAADAGKK